MSGLGADGLVYQFHILHLIAQSWTF